MQETGHNRQERRVLGALTSGQQLGLCVLRAMRSQCRILIKIRGKTTKQLN